MCDNKPNIRDAFYCPWIPGILTVQFTKLPNLEIGRDAGRPVSFAPLSDTLRKESMAPNISAGSYAKVFGLRPSDNNLNMGIYITRSILSRSSFS